MNIKLSKSKKIILLSSGLGVLTTSIVIPIVVINSNKNETDEDKVKKIISKIKDKDILIAPNVATQNQSEIQEAIKNQLQKENQTLTSNDLSKISTNISSLILGDRIEVILTFRINSKTQDLKIHVEKSNLLKNSKLLTDTTKLLTGNNGKIFQDSFKNLWAMGGNQKLQVLKANSTKKGYENSWVNDNDENTEDALLRNSNIDNALNGTIFQDEFKNLWIMGNNTKLQVLEVNSTGDGYVNKGWSNDNAQGLLNGSNITSGLEGVIFQDSFKNLWAMGENTKLQVLRVNSGNDGYVDKGWTNNTSKGLLNGSNITNGENGTIFQDSFGNLWSMGNGTRLQVLRVNSNNDGYVDEGWTNNTSQGLLSGSNITNGIGGTIFQDSFGNLWSMGEGTRLQVLKANTRGNGYVNQGWINNRFLKLLLRTNITNGENGIIFQDSFKNLWSMGNGTELQFLKVNSRGDGYANAWASWGNNADAEELLKDSNITNGENGTIFQDSFGNLWTMGLGTKLQVLKVNSRGDGYVSAWNNDETAQGLLKNSNMGKNQYATIFQDSFGNLWTMSSRNKLQVLKLNVNKKGYVDSWQS